MQLVDRQCLVVGLVLGAPGHPVLVLPVEHQGLHHPRTGGRRHLPGEGDRVGLERQQAIRAEDFVFVQLTGAQARNEQFPDPGRVAQAHGMAAAIPAIEFAHHRHPSGIRRPDSETHAGNSILLQQLGAQAAAQVTVVAFVEEVEVHFAQQGTEGVRVLGYLLGAGPADAQAIGAALRQVALEQAVRVGARHHAETVVVLGGEQLDAFGPRQPGPYPQAVGHGMGAQVAERVVFFRPSQAFQWFVAHVRCPSRWRASSNSPCRGTSSQSGRWPLS
ncbi:hypothetical protein D9M68_546340 [compost metagenome]